MKNAMENREVLICIMRLREKWHLGGTETLKLNWNNWN